MTHSLRLHRLLPLLFALSVLLLWQGYQPSTHLIREAVGDYAMAKYNNPLESPSVPLSVW